MSVALSQCSVRKIGTKLPRLTKHVHNRYCTVLC